MHEWKKSDHGRAVCSVSEGTLIFDPKGRKLELFFNRGHIVVARGVVSFDSFSNDELSKLLGLHTCEQCEGRGRAPTMLCETPQYVDCPACGGMGKATGGREAA